jgi:hypothetical protein
MRTSMEKVNVKLQGGRFCRQAGNVRLEAGAGCGNERVRLSPHFPPLP